MRPSASLTVRRAAVVLSFATLLLAPSPAASQLRRGTPTSLTDAEFWDLFSSSSEPGGTFSSENFVSNEMSFQHVIPTLQRTITPDGVYLGVGPEQNFTYIANLKPRLAVIFDIRRQNAMAHLMYKAIFELSPTRADFVSRLFSRPLAGRVAPTAKVADLFAVATAAARNDSAYQANTRAIFSTLVNKHHFALTPGDSAGIEHLLEVFYEAGPDINYGYRLGRPGSVMPIYPTYGALQTLTNAENVAMAFLADESNYQAVRDMHVRNLIVPVVGDFAGPKAIKAVGAYLRQRSMTVAAFYLSNVEQYLFQNGVAERFYENVASLPIDSTSTFIRSVPAGGGGGGFTIRAIGNASGNISFGSLIASTGGVPSGAVSVSVVDTGGYRQMRIVQDSGGYLRTRTYRDSAGAMVLQGTDSVPSRSAASLRDSMVRLAPSGAPLPFTPGHPTFIMGGSLTSGIAAIWKTLAEYSAGTIYTYRDIIAMTKIDGWK